MADRVWFHCAMCPDEVWKEEKERVRLPKPITIQGYKTFYLCKDHARQLVRYLKNKQRGETADGLGI